MNSCIWLVAGFLKVGRLIYIYINNINRGFLVPDNSPSTSFHSIQLSNAGDGQMSNCRASRPNVGAEGPAFWGLLLSKIMEDLGICQAFVHDISGNFHNLWDDSWISYTYITINPPFAVRPVSSCEVTASSASS